MLKNPFVAGLLLECILKVTSCAFLSRVLKTIFVFDFFDSDWKIVFLI